MPAPLNHLGCFANPILYPYEVNSVLTFLSVSETNRAPRGNLLKGALGNLVSTYSAPKLKILYHANNYKATFVAKMRVHVRLSQVTILSRLNSFTGKS